MTRHVLVVEDEAAILRGVLRSIERDPALRATGAYTVDEAVPILTADPPDILVTDLNLPGRHGLEMITELEKASLVIPIIIVTAHRAVYEPYFPRHCELTVLEKPVPTAVLLEQIHARLQEAQTEPIGPTFQVADYLQLAAMGHHSVVLRVAVEGSQEAWLEIVDGNVWNAFFGQLTGAEAVAALLNEPANAVATVAMKERPRTRQIEQSTEGLLLDLARRLDEAGRDRAEQRDGEATALTPSQRYAAVFEAGMEAVRNEDWQRAAAAFREALELRPDDKRARHNLERIARLGGAAAGLNQDERTSERG